MIFSVSGYPSINNTWILDIDVSLIRLLRNDGENLKSVGQKPLFWCLEQIYLVVWSTKNLRLLGKINLDCEWSLQYNQLADQFICRG